MPSIPLTLDLATAGGGLGTISVRLCLGSALAAVVPLTEISGLPGRYAGVFNAPASAALYDGPAMDGGGNLKGSFRFMTDSQGNEIIGSVDTSDINPLPALTLAPIMVALKDIVQASTLGGTYVSLTFFQGQEASYSWQVVDDTNAAVNMVGNTFRFTIHDSEGTILSQFNSTDNPSQFSQSSSVGGGPVDIVKVTLLPANLTTAGGFLYKMWNTTLLQPLATGQLGVIVAP